jgi:LuxR family maltose regulon positive regulatory protein
MAASEVPFDLAEVKLAPPSIRPGTVVKDDLIARLSAAPAPVVTVVAPAGYGKTTLLARWAEADPRPFAWVVLDAGDSDAVVFMRYIAAAMHRLERVSSDVFAALSGPKGYMWASRVPRLGAALAALEHPLVLALDDLHLVANPSCLDVVTELVRYVPNGSKIAIASRQEPALPFARWRTNGQVDEVGVADLRLDEREAASLLRAAGIELSAGDLSDLTERTEGWPAGLYLAALSIQTGAPGSLGGDGFNGDDRFVSEYFHGELLSRLPPAEATFLKYTSVLDRLSGGLCDAVLETTGSADRLDALERTNGFVVRLDRRRRWYRYHHLFRQLLRNELERSEPGMVLETNRRAMAWCIANDLPEQAIVYGEAAGDREAVAGLVDRLALAVYFDGRQETVEEWLGWFDEDELSQYPALAVYGAWIRVLTGRPTEAEQRLALADGATSTIALSDGSATVEPWVATLRSCMMPEGAERAVADADLALDQLPSTSGWAPVALLNRGIAHALLGATDRAKDDLGTTIERSLAVGIVQAAYVAQAKLSLLAADEGAWGEAGERARAARGLVEATGLGDYAGSAMAYVAMARLALHEARQDDARAALAGAHRLRPLLDHGLPWLTVEVGLEIVRAHLALGEPAAARTDLTETERVLELRPGLGVLAERARDLADRVKASSGSAGRWAMTLTGAELRLLPYLATHLTFPEIGSRLFLSRNTVKTEAVSIYRKLSASSRSEAIERAIEVGLLESSLLSPRVNLTQEG